MVRPGPILFHLCRAARDVKRAGGQGLFQEVPVELRAHIIDVGFDHGNDLVTGQARLASNGLNLVRR